MKRIISIAACIIMTAALSQSYAQHRRPDEKGKKHRTEQNSRRHNHHDKHNNHSHRSLHSPRFDADMFEHHAEHLKDLLDLRDRQYKKVVALGREQMKKAKKIGKHSHKKMKKLSAKAKAASRKQFREMRSEYEAEMKKILDRKQWKKYQEFRKRR